MTISNGYRDLNAALHATSPEYGTSGQAYAADVAAVAKFIGARSLLDYGAGKRTLEAALGDMGFPVSAYDPAVPGIDRRPAPADVVTCTDVLEHVEPDFLDAVLADLAGLTQRIVFLAVATGPAQKSLADGRNAHLIQKPWEWWQPRIEKHWRLIRLWDTGRGFVFIGQSLSDPGATPVLNHIGPPPTTTRITCKSVFTDEQRCANIRSSMLRGLPQVQALPAHGRTMVLACYGPSLKDTVPLLRLDMRHNADLVTVSGAHSFLIEQGIVPKFHVESDPRAHKATLIGKADPRVVYLLASACARETFDLVAGKETFVYHVTSSTAESNLIRQMGGPFTIDGGTNVGMGAIALGTVLGYRTFVIHGMDGCFRADAKYLHWPRNEPIPADLRQHVGFHAGAHPNEDQDLYRVWVGNRPFITSPQMLQSAQDFMVLRNHPAGIRMTLRGDGFIRALWEHTCQKRKAA